MGNNQARPIVGQPLQARDEQYGDAVTISVLGCRQLHVGAVRPGDQVSYFSGIVVWGPGTGRVVEGHMVTTALLNFEPRLLPAPERSWR